MWVTESRLDIAVRAGGEDGGGDVGRSLLEVGKLAFLRH
jgi:hypothetical protein